MTDTEFKEALTGYKYYLKPALFTVLAQNADVFSDKTKQEIIIKLKEADDQMKGLHDYQEKRIKIMKRGLDKIEDFYTDVKSKFKKFTEKEKAGDEAEAENLISNM